MSRICFSTFVWLAFILPAAAQVSITEFLSENRTGITDADGDTSDWIEISSLAAGPTAMTGWHLTDDPEELTKWSFPAVTLPAGSSLVVFASGKDRSDPAGELHTSFSLDSGGEYLALVAPDGVTVVSDFNYPAQFEDISYGASARVISEVVVAENAPAKWIVPGSAINGWNGRQFNDVAWVSGATGVGYDTSSDYAPYIDDDSNILSQMRNVNGSVYIRIPFQVTNPENVASLVLNMRYDDGFSAWINGQPVASSRSPEVPLWNSLATNFHSDSVATIPEQFGASSGISALVSGENILAIQGMNWTLDSSDLLMLPELSARTVDPAAPGSSGYLSPPTPGEVNGNAVSGFVADTKFSADRGFYDEAFTVAITTETEGATIRYTTNGVLPDEQTGTVYSQPITVSSTTTLRAVAYKAGYQSTNVDTQSYFFAGDVTEQADMDSDVVDDPAYSATIEDDLSANLPVFSLTVDEGEFFGPDGIYSNPNRTGRGSEVPVSMEFFNPADPSDQFQIDAGVRIHGGNARTHPKKHLRFYFRGEYGERRLKHPIFPDGPVESFDQLLFRSGGHDSWSIGSRFGRDPLRNMPPHGTIMRDQFLRKTELEMGILTPRSRYVHVYINTRYWGVYDLHERANAAFFESYLGGEEEDYDVLHHPSGTIVDGNTTAWNEARAIVAGGISSPAEYAAIQEYIDLEDYIDHLIVRIWSGDYDWCGPLYLNGVDETHFRRKNWYAGRRSRGNPGKFRFFTWDAEMSMGLHLGQPGNQGITNFDLTGVNDSGSAMEFYGALRAYPDFQLLFADHLHRHFFNDGLMTVTSNQERMDAMTEELRDAMVGESARWGDEGTSSPTPFTRDDTWLPEVSWLRNDFIGVRTNIVLQQFRDRGLYPDTEAPVFNQHGGSVPAGFSLTMTSPGAIIYYTTDGSDPRLSDDAVRYTGAFALGQSVLMKARAFRSSRDEWSALAETTFLVGELASSSNLVVSELNYRPRPPAGNAELAVANSRTDFEFIELKNIGSSAIDLTGLSFSQGIGFTFGLETPLRMLDPGEELLIVEDSSALAARYGNAILERIAGEFEDDSKLSNDGENITLLAADGEVIKTFRYSDEEPWPAAPDGEGFTLSLVDPAGNPDHSLPESWAASTRIDGDPAGETSSIGFDYWVSEHFDASAPDFEQVSDPGADPDGDTMSNAMEYAFGTSPNDSSEVPQIEVLIVNVDGEDYLAVRFLAQPSVNDLQISGEVSNNLGFWQSATTAVGEAVATADGRQWLILRSNDPVVGVATRQIRLRVEISR
ncbi:MAG: hypothetical protein GY899_15150 [Verrucomicrobiaceae bacterium]|nr:hypothetical protein [Verrucomicrobiaceae bacterium]